MYLEEACCVPLRCTYMERPFRLPARLLDGVHTAAPICRHVALYAQRSALLDSATTKIRR
jgi:hypothetical protein